MVAGLPVLCPPGASFFELFVPGGEDGWGATFKHILGSDKADGAVQAHGVVVLDELTDYAPGILLTKWGLGPDGLLLEGAVKTLQLAVALRVMRRAEHVSRLPEANELLEILSHELAAAVGNDAWPCSGPLPPPPPPPPTKPTQR